MSTKNHNASHERPPSNERRRNILGENLLTVITIIGVIGELCHKSIHTVKSLTAPPPISLRRWHDIWTYLKKFRQSMDGTWNHVHSISRWSVFKDAEMFNCTTDSFIDNQRYWCARLNSFEKNRFEVSFYFKKEYLRKSLLQFWSFPTRPEEKSQIEPPVA